MKQAEMNNQIFTYESIAKLFHIPMLQASILCGLDLSDFKKLMKKLGPYSYKRDTTRYDINTFVEFKVKHAKTPIGVQKTTKNEITIINLDKISISNLINE